MNHKEEKKLKERKEVLEIEVLEKKYANELFYSDVEPYEVIEEKTADKYLIRQMKCNFYHGGRRFNITASPLKVLILIFD